MSGVAISWAYIFVFHLSDQFELPFTVLIQDLLVGFLSLIPTIKMFLRSWVSYWIHIQWHIVSA